MTRFAALDIEVTGFDPILDRIIEIRCCEVDLPHCTIVLEEWGGYCNPGIPIKPEATARHGKKDADVADCPPFKERAAWIQNRLQGAVLIAYNGRRHDLQFLHHELVRAGQQGLPPSTPVIDPLDLFREDCPHTLTGALQYYCGQRHPAAHNARADVYAMLNVLSMQLAVRPHQEVLRKAQFPRRLDHAGWFLEGRDGIIRFGIGKYRGLPASEHPDYLRWMLKSNFPDAAKQLARELMKPSSEVLGRGAA